MPSTCVVANAAGVEPTLTTSIAIPFRRRRFAVATIASPARRAMSTISSHVAARPACPSCVMIPQRRSPGICTISRANRKAGSPGATPARPSPVSISSRTSSRFPAEATARLSGSATATLSTATATCSRSSKARRRAIFCSPTIWYARRTSSTTPAAASASTSPSLAQVTPTAPDCRCMVAISAVLCVLTCGRKARPRDRA
ncbi:hypothetical protein HRbin27_01672 [bacterium HR27]|nr:hypothetical protein HRbin27_01672 [bacterium HR27]